MTTPTPRTDAVAGDDFLVNPDTDEVYVPAKFARQLERELNQWKEDAERLSKQLKSRCEGDWSASDIVKALSLHEQLVKGTKK